LIRAIRENKTSVQLVTAISTDKACKPINVMGMTKALQERFLVQANMDCPKTRFTCVRYGNVIASRGSVVPLFLEQIQHGGPLTITVQEMTRFLLNLDQAVDTVFTALRDGLPGETYVPKIPSARVLDIADVLINRRDIQIVYTGIRPGEKVHEVLVSEEERYRTIERGDHYVIRPILPELRSTPVDELVLKDEYSSQHVIVHREELRGLLAPYVESELKGIQT
jgi:UDP-glucose 4-epimerase